MHTHIRVRPMLDAPSFVHLSWLEHDPPQAAIRDRRPLSARLSSLLRRIGHHFFDEAGSPWI
ncbi:MAG: hypothetical protein ACYC02_05425 [Thiobacillus sp.]